MRSVLWGTPGSRRDFQNNMLAETSRQCVLRLISRLWLENYHKPEILVCTFKTVISKSRQEFSLRYVLSSTKLYKCKFMLLSNREQLESLNTLNNSESSRKHPSTMMTKLYSNVSSWIVNSLWSLKPVVDEVVVTRGCGYSMVKCVLANDHVHGIEG